MTKEKIGPDWQEIRTTPDNVGKDWIVKNMGKTMRGIVEFGLHFFPPQTDLSIPTVMDAGILEALLAR